MSKRQSMIDNTETKYNELLDEYASIAIENDELTEEVGKMEITIEFLTEQYINAVNRAESKMAEMEARLEALESRV